MAKKYIVVYPYRRDTFDEKDVEYIKKLLERLNLKNRGRCPRGSVTCRPFTEQECEKCRTATYEKSTDLVGVMLVDAFEIYDNFVEHDYSKIDELAEKIRKAINRRVYDVSVEEYGY